MTLVTGDVWELLKFAGLYQKGLPPVAGGALDQAKIFIDAVDFIIEEENRIKKKLGYFGDE